MPEDPLALETRRRVYRAVRSHPGSGARELQRLSKTAWGEAVYHLDRLTEAGLIHRERGTHQDHYFAPEVPIPDRQVLGLLRSASARRVLEGLLEFPASTLPDLAGRTGLSRGRLSVHLHRLMRIDLVRSGRSGRRRSFELSDPERVMRLLVTYSDGFADEWIERILATWSELFRP